MRRELALGVVLLAPLAIAACGWNPQKPFERDAPAVKAAIAALDGGDAQAAASTLEGYLSTGACNEGNIGTPELLKKRADGTFDLGLSLFGIGESYGKRFGDEETAAGGGARSADAKDQAASDEASSKRRAEVECALRVVRAIADDPSTPIELAARARYLEGNLSFLAALYEDAVHAYDKALVLAPGLDDGGDPIGRDAAWNRAIALRRIDDKKDAGQDAAPDASNDAPNDSPNDAPNDAGSEGGKNDAGKDGGGPGDAGADAPHDSGGDHDAAQKPEPPPPAPDAAAPPPPSSNQDDRMLDQLENAPTVQQQQLRQRGPRRRVGAGMDK